MILMRAGGILRGGLLAFLVAGGAFGVQAGGYVVAWGDNSTGETNVPPGLTNVIAIAGGSWHSAAVTAEGRIIAWGGSWSGATNVAPDLTNVIAITALGYENLALCADGTITTWRGFYPFEAPPGLSNIVWIDTGDHQSIALKAEGTLATWGTQRPYQEHIAPGLSNIVAVASSGYANYLALQADGTVVAWGDNGHGQTNVPPDLTNVVAVTSGGEVGLALKGDGTLAVWGTEFVLGPAELPPNLTNMVAIHRNLALREDGTVWELSPYARLLKANPVPWLSNVTTIAQGSGHSLAIVGDGSPHITVAPFHRSVFSGKTVRLDAKAAGIGPLFYQWQHNGTNLAGGTNAFLVLRDVRADQAGSYAVSISNALGSATTNATLAVQEHPPFFLVWPLPRSVHPGGPAVLQARLEGSGPMEYQWFWNDAAIPDATNLTYAIPTAGTNQNGQYALEVRNPFGVVRSTNVPLGIVPAAAWGDNWFGQTAIPPALTNITALAGGFAHTLALLADGTVAAWGLNEYGQTQVPQGLSNVVAIAAGTYHSLALRADATVVAWGAGTTYDFAGAHRGQAMVPASLRNVMAIAAGDTHSLALKADGTVAAWGNNDDDALEVPADLTNVVAIAGGSDFSLALKANGTVVCWGRYWGLDRRVLPTLTNIVALAARDNHSTVLRDDGTVFGLNGSHADMPRGFSNVVAIAEGSGHYLALRNDGALAVWGAGTDRIGEFNYGQSMIPAGLTNPVAIAAGGYFSLAVTGDGSPRLLIPPFSRTVFSGKSVSFHAKATGVPPLQYQWQFNGADLNGATNASLTLADPQTNQAGNYTVIIRNSRGAVTSAVAVLTVVESAPVVVESPPDRTTYIGGSVAFGVTADGSFPLAYQWRLNGSNLPGATAASLVLSNANLSYAGQYSILVSNRLGVALSADATLTLVPIAAWGNTNFGLLEVPLNLTNAIGIAAGTHHSLAIKADRSAVGWGSLVDQTPVALDLTNVMALAGGETHGLALRGDGTVIAFGPGSYPDYRQTNMPAGLTNISAIAAGHNHSLVLKRDGTVVAWGDNWGGQTNVPPDLSNVVAIAAGRIHSVALKADGTVVAWGNNVYGQVEVPAGLTNVVAIATGMDNSLALRRDGTVALWGADVYDQADFLAGLSNVIAVAAGCWFSMALKQDGTLAVCGGDAYGENQPPPNLTNLVGIAAGSYHGLALAGNGAPVLTVLPPARQIVFSGKTITLQAMVAGRPPFHCQWRLNGTNLPPAAGATNTTLLLTNVALESSGFYSVVISNALGEVASRDSEVVVVPAPPAIVIQPTNQVSFAGGAVRFLVVPDGSWPFSYQWLCNGTNLLDGTNQLLALEALRLNQAGQYRVEVRNAWGSATSAVAVLALTPIVAWGNNSDNQTNVPAELATSCGKVVAVAAGSTHSLALREDGTVVAWGAGTNNAGYADFYGQAIVPAGLSNVVAIAAGSYHSLALQADGRVVAWGRNQNGQTDVPPDLTNVMAIAAGPDHNLALRGDGTVTGWGDYTRGQLNVPPGLKDVVAIAAGGTFSLALKADGAVVAWGTDGYGQEVPIPNHLRRPGSGVMALVASGGYCMALLRGGTPVVWAINISSQFYVQNLIPPGLSNVVAIAPGLGLRRDGTVVGFGSQTNIPPAVSNIVAIANGAHFLALAGDGAPWITAAPFGQPVLAGHTATFQVMAVGTPPLSYQWQYNGTNLPGANDTRLILPNVAPDQSGVYAVAISNAQGLVTSAAAPLRVVVNSPPFVQLPPDDQVFYPGMPVSLEVVADGADPLAYQWRWNGALIPGATQPVFMFGPLARHAGQYLAEITNAFGSVTSAPARLALLPVVPWGPSASFQTNQVLNRTDLVAVAAGGLSLALSRNGVVVPLDQHGSAIGTNDLLNLTNIMAIASGSSHWLALRADGRVVVKGYNSYGQTNVPAALTLPESGVVDLAAGDAHSMALKADGTVVVWGDNRFQQRRVPPDLTNVLAIAANGFNSLALKADGTIAAWGTYASLQTTAPPGLNEVVAVAVGSGHAVALKANGTVVAWGGSYSGETNVPPGLTNVAAIGASGSSSLALTGDGAPVLTVLPNGRELYSGHSVTLHARAAGAPPLQYQWQFNGVDLPGANSSSLTLPAVQGSQSGNYSVRISNALGTTVSPQVSVVVLEAPPVVLSQPSSQVAFAARRAELSVTADGSQPLYYQWYRDGVPLPGATNAVFVLDPVRYDHGGAYAVGVANQYGSVASQAATVTVVPIAAWGINNYGQTDIPLDLTNITAIVAGYWHCLALCSDCTVRGWGYNAYNQISLPPGLTNVMAVAAGYWHSLALRDDGTVVVWGRNSSSQTNAPAGLSNVVAVAGGGTHSLALRADGTVAAWGDNLYNQCRVPAWLSNVVAIAGGGNHSLALRQDGRVVAWGRNTYAQTNVPAGLSNLVAIAAGENHSLALRANGTLAQWGTAIPSLPALNDVVAIAAGGDHNLALRASGEVVAWGFNDSGQTNVPYGLTLPGSGAIALAAGENHSLVLEGDGRARFPAVSRLAQDPARHLFTLALPTARGRRYVIEYKNQLADTNWTLLPLLLGDGAEHALSDTNATPAWRFYRLR